MTQLSPDLSAWLDRLDQGEAITAPELESLLASTPLTELIKLSHQLTQRSSSTTFNTCAIINAKADGCSCDCAWCAQSRHWNPDVAASEMVDTSTTLIAAHSVEDKGIGRFSLVTAGRKLSRNDIRKAIVLLETLRTELPQMELCASFGLQTEHELAALKDAGLKRYHCNLETSEAHFARVCHTHTRADKIATLKAARSAGLELCSGCLFGIGETEADRIELALTLRDLAIPSIPINILSPIAGTPLATAQKLSDDAILRAVVILRLANPTAYLRLAGGRNRLHAELVFKMMYAGVNSAIMGDFLTTEGSSAAEDALCAQLAGYELENAMVVAKSKGALAKKTPLADRTISLRPMSR